MKHKGKIVTIAVFICFLTLPWMLWYAPGKTGKTVRKTCAYELNENRNIYDLEDGIENAYNDRIPFRSFLITTYQNANQALDKVYTTGPQKVLISLLYEDSQESTVTETVDESQYTWLMGGKEENMVEEDHIHDYVLTKVVEPSYDGAGYTVYTCSYCQNEIRTDYKDKLIDTSYFPPNMSDTFVVSGRNDWLFLFDYRHMYDLYQGINLLEDKKLKERKETYETLESECEKHDIKLAFLIAPAKYQVYDEYMPSMDIESEEKQMDQVVNYLGENTDLCVCYPKDELNYVDRYYQTYFRYDSHWNQVGGYIGVMSLYKGLGLEVTPINSLEIKQAKKHPTKCVDLFGMIGQDYSDFEHKDYNYKVVYKPEVTAENVPTTPTYEMEPLQEMTSDVDNDLHFVLMGDSFRAQLAPYVAKDFAKTSFIDRNCISRDSMEGRGYDFGKLVDQMVADVEDADYLVIELTEANEDLMMDYAIYLINVLKDME